MSLQIQYTIVAIILIAACVWILRSFLRMRRKNRCHSDGCESTDADPTCVGCGLADACNSVRKEKGTEPRKQ